MRRIAIAATCLLLAACAPEPATGPRPCAAWHCELPPGSPLAWTRPRKGRLDIADTSDLCERHASQAPFVLAGRFFLVYGIVPALAFGYITFRVIHIFDRHGPGLARFGETAGRRILFGTPVLVLVGWLTFFVIRAW